MKASIQKRIEAAKARAVAKPKRCLCGDLVGCRECRRRQHYRNAARRRAGLGEVALPPLSRCACGACRKCKHREVMRAWRGRRKAEMRDMEILAVYCSEVLRKQ